MGLRGGSIFGATFWEQFGLIKTLIMTSAAQTKRKKCESKKLKLFKPGTLDQCILKWITAAWRVYFWCHILETIWLDYDIECDKRGANEKKEMRPQKIKTREAQMNTTKKCELF